MSEQKVSAAQKAEQMRPQRGVRVPGQKLDFGTVKRVLKYLFNYKGRLLIVMLCIIATALCTAYSATFVGDLINDYVTPVLKDGAAPDYDGLLRSILIMLAIYTFSALCGFFFNRIMAVVSQGVLRDIRDTMFTKMQKLPVRYFDTHNFGDTMSCYTNDTDTMRMMISQSIPQIFSSLCTIIAVLVSMIILNVWLTLFIVATAVAMMFLVKFIGGKSGKYFIKQQRSVGQLNGYIEERINGQKVVQVFTREEKTKEEFDALNGELFENASKAHIFANVLGPIMNNLGHLQYILIAIIGGAITMIEGSGLLVGDVISFLRLSKNFTNPVNQVSQQLNSIIMALAGAKRIFELMDEEPEVDEGYVTLVNAKYDENGELTESAERTGMWAWKHPHSADGSVTYTLLRGDVRFHDVTFGYNEKKTVLHNVSLYAKPGQKIAFVGSTGAGKTTITNLINRFYDVQEGKITYDGINIKKIKKDDLRRSLAMVLQDTHLFTGTVEDNIRYGRLDATHDEIVAAAKLANADSFITRLPDGYNTVLTGDGGNLSQGQRQLLAIARAAVADPPVLILDEATSSIDTRTERLIEKGMDKLMENKTVFVIAHRLSTVRNSNAIMVLENGEIIEKGDHDTLIEAKGKYYKLYTGQFELS